MNEENTINLQEAPTEQLKAVAFDMILERDRLNANLDAIGQELHKRTQPADEDLSRETPATDTVTEKIYEATGGKKKKS